MQIVRIRSHVVDLPLPAPFHPAWARGRNQTNILMVLVEVDTDAGITGYGAAHAGPEAAIASNVSSLPISLARTPRASSVSPPCCAMPRFSARQCISWSSRCGTSSASRANLPVYKLWGAARIVLRPTAPLPRSVPPEQRVSRCRSHRGRGLSRDEAALPP